jgi:3,8-divinyl chlorophyllide a/chlorophyllide a reductase subunit Y
MQAFFEGVGDGATAGVWEKQPMLRPEFAETYKRKMEKQAKARKSEEMV